MLCDECKKVLEEPEEDESYPWVFVNGHIYCRSCADKP